MIVCTSVCYNYIPKAKVLAGSLKKHNPGVGFVLCLVENEVHPAAKDPVFDFVVIAGELGIPDFESFMFRHSIVEASTAVKGHLFKELFMRFPKENEFIYLDPDILVTGPFIELSEELKKHDIMLTPHLCEPEKDFEAVLDNEVCALKHGVFNLGFLALRRSKEAERFIDWWSSRLYELCYADIPAGLFTDQRWIDLAPCFFDIFVFRNPGYNAAPWNLSRRKITESNKGEYLSNGLPLRFFHFSGFDSGANEQMVSKYCPDKTDSVYKIRNSYIEMCDKNGQKELGKLPWSYNFYSNGERIENSHRLAYRSNAELRDRFKDPFNAGSKPSFYDYVRKSGALRFQKPPAGIKLLIEQIRQAYHDGGIRLVFEKTLKFIGNNVTRKKKA